MNKNRITLITLGVRDLPRATKFYQDLGWVAEEILPLVAFFDMNGAKFGLYSLEKLAEDLGRDVDTLGNGATTLAQNFATEAEVNEAFALAIAAGATECKAPEKIFWGGSSGTFADPEGHIWELAMNPFWGMDDEGKLK